MLAQMTARAPVSLAAEMAATVPALAFGTQSTDTDLSLDLCTITESNDFGTTWACPGYKGIPVMVAATKLRFMVSYGLKSTEEPAAKQTLPPANSLGPTIEWRLSNKEGRWKPFATILKYLVGDEGKPKGEVLVVTRLGEGSTCQIASWRGARSSSASCRTFTTTDRPVARCVAR
mgnify:CR=1 FL=1